MATKANEVTSVVVSVYVKPTGGRTPIIVVEEAIVEGKGTLTEVIDGGQVKLNLQLTSGREVKPLVAKQSVHVHGVRNGEKFILASPLTIVESVRPWDFSGISGSEG